MKMMKKMGRGVGGGGQGWGWNGEIATYSYVCALYVVHLRRISGTK